MFPVEVVVDHHRSTAFVLPRDNIDSLSPLQFSYSHFPSGAASMPFVVARLRARLLTLSVPGLQIITDPGILALYHFAACPGPSYEPGFRWV